MPVTLRESNSSPESLFYFPVAHLLHRVHAFLSCYSLHSPVYCGVLFSLNALRPSSLSLVGIT